MSHTSRLRRTLSRWADSSGQEERDLRDEYDAARSQKVAETHDRQRVQLCGRLRTVTLRPRGGVPALEAELDDGTGSITIIWLGRRRIVGIDPGVSMRVQGRIGEQDGRRILYNPRYELLP